MKKLISFVIILLAMATGAGAQTDFGFYIDGKDINSSNYLSASNGRPWSYDPDTNVLHLKEGTIETDLSYALIIYGNRNPTLNIQVDGHCYIKGSYVRGLVFFGKGSHTICGDGTLQMTSSNDEALFIATDTEKTDLVIRDVTIYINGGSRAIGFYSANFGSILLDHCRLEISTINSVAWRGEADNYVYPVLKNCFMMDGWWNRGGAVDEMGRIFLSNLEIERTIIL